MNRKLALAVTAAALLAGCASTATTATAPARTTTAATACQGGMTPDANGVCQPGGVTPTDLATAPAPAQQFRKVYNGYGQQNTAQFDVSACQNGVSIAYSYSGNTLPGVDSGDNFIADLASSDDDQSIVNDIAASGGKTTIVYPDTQFGGSTMYRLQVQAAQNARWKFTITCA